MGLGVNRYRQAPSADRRGAASRSRPLSAEIDSFGPNH